jgi:hypothetical protein
MYPMQNSLYCYHSGKAPWAWFMPSLFCAIEEQTMEISHASARVCARAWVHTLVCVRACVCVMELVRQWLVVLRISSCIYCNLWFRVLFPLPHQRVSYSFPWYCIETRQECCPFPFYHAVGSLWCINKYVCCTTQVCIVITLQTCVQEVFGWVLPGPLAGTTDVFLCFLQALQEKTRLLP